MGKETIFIQIGPAEPGCNRDWKNIPAKKMTFRDEDSAVNFCDNLASFLGKELRVSSTDIKTEVSGGNYFFPQTQD